MLELVLPWPPSANRAWRTAMVAGHASTYVSSEGKEYRKTVARIVTRTNSAKGTTARIRLHIRACPPDRRQRDLDNILKVTFDALTCANVWDDDEQVDEIHLVRGECKGDPGFLYISIEELPDAQAALPIERIPEKAMRKPKERALAF